MTHTKNPSCDFECRFMLALAKKANGIGLCSYLITLAAIQRGLIVKFITSANFGAFDGTRRSTDGQLYEISDGATSRLFSRSFVDTTDREANKAANDKFLSKQLVHNAGGKTPIGMVGPASSRDNVKRFLSENDGLSYVVKPLAGSLAENVVVDLSSSELMKELDERGNELVVLEQYIKGIEYRAFVVGNKAVAVSRRYKPTIVGDGKLSIADLISKKKYDLEMANPFWTGFKSHNALRRLIERAGFNLGDVLPVGIKVRLTETSDGVIHQNVTDTVDHSIKIAAVNAVKAVGLKSAGVDLIVTNDGCCYFLEVNQRAHIGLHSFPTIGKGLGNRVAEALIDYHFPNTIDSKREVAFGYNFETVVDGLKSGQMKSIEVPRIVEGQSLVTKQYVGDSAVRDASDLLRRARELGLACTGLQFSDGSCEVRMLGVEEIKQHTHEFRRQDCGRSSVCP